MSALGQKRKSVTALNLVRFWLRADVFERYGQSSFLTLGRHSLDYAIYRVGTEIQ